MCASRHKKVVLDDRAANPSESRQIWQIWRILAGLANLGDSERNWRYRRDAVHVARGDHAWCGSGRGPAGPPMMHCVLYRTAMNTSQMVEKRVLCSDARRVMSARCCRVQTVLPCAFKLA